MDTKKNELIGQYKNGGRGWMPTGEPVKVKTHDFLDRQGPGKAIRTGSTTSPRPPPAPD
ncbi:hypothetical protein RKD38_000965 [Streptomyces ambofaciens]